MSKVSKPLNQINSIAYKMKNHLWDNNRTIVLYNSITLLKIKVLYWHRWFHEELWKCSKSIKMIFTLRKKVLLRIHWKVLWGTRNGSSVALQQKPPLDPLFLRVFFFFFFENRTASRFPTLTRHKSPHDLSIRVCFHPQNISQHHSRTLKAWYERAESVRKHFKQWRAAVVELN